MELLGTVLCTNPDLLRTVLCPNARQCAGHRDGSCCFAHSMAALMPPDESIRDHTAAWNGFVDLVVGFHGRASVAPGPMLMHLV